MRTKKQFYVIAYDIRDNKRRRKVVKCVEKYGGRINLSVFECMLARADTDALKKDLSEIIDAKSDQIVLYPLCIDCFSKVEYIPDVVRDCDVVLVK